jgi:hypothetical protein
MKKTKLVPPSKTRCQAKVVKGGCYPDAEHFMMLGGHGKLVQCNKKPVVTVYENKPDKKDGLKGSMSLCASCLAEFKRRMPKNFATVKPLVKSKP